MAEPGTTAAAPVQPPAPAPAWRAPVAGIASALVIFCAVIVAAMAFKYAQERLADPLNNKELVELRAKFILTPEDGDGIKELKSAIREKDRTVRRDFFRIQWHLNSAAWMLVVAGSVLVILLNILIVTKAPAPDADSLTLRGGVWNVADRERRALAAFAVSLVVLAAIAVAVFGRGAALPEDKGGATAIRNSGR